MKFPATSSKTASIQQNDEQPISSEKDGLATAPPAYGIDFLDRGLTLADTDPGLHSGSTVQRKAALSTAGDAGPHPENHTGLPDSLKTGVERLSGFPLDDVRVHYNSSNPAQLQALAYTKGADIFVAPSQERHLPHEAWHVVQQKQGRVQTTRQAKGVEINDDPRLEREADSMGAKAAGALGKNSPHQRDANTLAAPVHSPVVQRLVATDETLYVPPRWTAQTVTWNDSQRTVDRILENPKDKQTFIGYVKNALGLPALKDIEKHAGGADVFQALTASLPKSKTNTRIAKQKINTAFQASRRLLRLGSERITDAAALQEELILRVQDMIPETSDLEETPNPTFVCALIALVRNEGFASIKGFLTAKKETPPAKETVQNYAYALHAYYRKQGVEYDELASHLMLYNEWGYHLVFSGMRKFGTLWQAGLKTGKKYILDIKLEVTEMGGTKKIKGHSMAAAMKKNYDKAPAKEERMGDYFTLYNESWNWNYGDIVNFTADIIYVFEK